MHSNRQPLPKNVHVIILHLSFIFYQYIDMITHDFNVSCQVKKNKSMQTKELSMGINKNRYFHCDLKNLILHCKRIFISWVIKVKNSYVNKIFKNIKQYVSFYYLLISKKHNKKVFYVKVEIIKVQNPKYYNTFYRIFE